MNEVEYHRMMEAQEEGKELDRRVRLVIAFAQGQGKNADVPWDRLVRNVYKYTDCGASLWRDESSPGRIVISSIVEGVDRTTEAHELIYPFTAKQYNEAVEAVEKEVGEIWRETHGCEDCGEPDEFGERAINPECKSCEGQGVIL